MYCKVFVFIREKTADELRISDWSSDVGSSDLADPAVHIARPGIIGRHRQRIAAAIIVQHPLEIRGTQHDVVAGVVERTEIGRASCREGVCQYVSISVVAVALNKKTEKITIANSHVST